MSSIKIWEHFQNAGDQKLNHGITVRGVRVRRSICQLDRLKDLVVLSKFDELLEDVTLKLEAGQVAAVGHNGQSFSDDQSVEADVENGADAWDRGDSVVEIPHTLEADFHYLRLFVLHGENDGVDDGLEHLTLQLKHSLCAVNDNIMH